MVPINFEENIREKLQERELQPNKETWKKLSAQLDLQKPQKKSNSFFWMAVAASFIGVVLIASFLFRSDTSEAPLVVEKSHKSIPEEEQGEQPVNVVEGGQESELLEHRITKETELASSVPEIDSDKKSETTAQKSIPTTTVNKKIISSEEEAVAITSSVEKLPVKSVEESKEDFFINRKIEDVVAEVQTLQQNNNSVTPDEIDALLAKAQREISNQRMLNSNARRIDPSALLSDVELELEQSFREKVFQMLGEGFIKIRTAVSERNN